MEFTPLTDEQRQRFDRDGFLVVPKALCADLVSRLEIACDRLYAEGCARDGLTGHSHLVMRPPSPADTRPTHKASGWHRDGGTAPSDLGRALPRMFIKIAYWLSDLGEPGRGAIRLLPGSNDTSVKPPEGEDDGERLEIRAQPGDAVLFENRTLHAVGPNFSEITRKGLFFGYGYRWLRPMDYITQPAEVLDRCDPVRRQLLGDCTSPMGFQLPQPEDVPLKAWLEEHDRPALSARTETPGAFDSR